MIASITLLADAFHETARVLAVTQRQRLRVVAARLVENMEDPASLFADAGELSCTVISLTLGEQADALRLMICRPRGGNQELTSECLADLMANAIAMKIITWTSNDVGFACVPSPRGQWPEVIPQAMSGMRSPASGIGVVVAEIGSGGARCRVLACLFGDEQAGIAQWVPTMTFKGV
jgi:hypothetical protein